MPREIAACLVDDAGRLVANNGLWRAGGGFKGEVGERYAALYQGVREACGVPAGDDDALLRALEALLSPGHVAFEVTCVELASRYWGGLVVAGRWLAEHECALIEHHTIAELLIAKRREQAARQRFEIATEGANDAVYWLDAVRDHRGEVIDFMFMHASRRAELALGRDLTTLPGQHLRLHAPIASQVDFFEAYLRVYRDGAREERVYETPRVDGSAGVYQRVVAPTPSGVAVFDRDITDLTEARAALQATADRLELAVASAQLGIFELDGAARTMTWSARMYEIHGVIGEPGQPIPLEVWREGILPEDVGPISARIEAALMHGQGFSARFRVQWLDGSVRHVRTRALILRGRGERAPRLVGTCADVTHEYEQQQRIRDLDAQLAHASRLEALGTMAGGVTHDFNNILASIQASLDLLARRASPDLDPPLTMLRKSVRWGRDLTSRILRLAGHVARQRERADPATLVREAVDVVAPLLPSTARLTVEVGGALPPIEVERGELVSVLMNLLTNARDALKPDGGRIVLRAHRHGAAQVAFEVVDDGVGMPQEVRARALDPFFTTKRARKGTGLGLAITQAVVHGHGGALELDSVVGAGTTVRVLLPVAPGHEAQPITGPALDDVAARRDQRPTSSEPPSLDPLRVLYLEDDPDMRRAIETLLRNRGLEVSAHATGEGALRALGCEGAFDVALLDHHIRGGLGGSETAQALRARAPEMPIIVLTGQPTADGLREPDAPLYTRVLCKPVRIKALLTALQEVTGA